MAHFKFEFFSDYLKKLQSNYQFIRIHEPKQGSGEKYCYVDMVFDDFEKLLKDLRVDVIMMEDGDPDWPESIFSLAAQKPGDKTSRIFNFTIVERR